MARKIPLIIVILLVFFFFWLGSRPVDAPHIEVSVHTPVPTPSMTLKSLEITPTATNKNPDQLELEASALNDDRSVIRVEKKETPATGIIVGPREISQIAPQPVPTSDGEPVLEPDDARQIFSSLDERKNPPVDDDRIFGRRGSVNAAPIEGEPTPRATTTVPPAAGLAWVHGQSRGYAMLYAMHPKARAVVEGQVRTLLESRIRQPMIGVLFDGTFTQDFEYLRSVITRLSAEGRELTLALYLTNGATMRKWDTTPIDVLFTRINPLDFRNLIIYDQETRRRYLHVVSQAKEIFQFNSERSQLNKNIALVMLEDNLDYTAYQNMRSLAGQQLGTIAQFVRNPCVGCFDGNNGDSQGDSREEHRISFFDSLGQGDTFTFDGIGFRYPEDSGGSDVTAEQLLDLMDRGLDKQLRYMGLWRHPWQGVVEGVANKHPDERNYQPSSELQRQFEITALRHGLELEVLVD